MYWQQGFLQVLRKGRDWRSLPRTSQRLVAVYTLSSIVRQSLLILAAIASDTVSGQDVVA
jgi:hypothetical protein